MQRRNIAIIVGAVVALVIAGVVVVAAGGDDEAVTTTTTTTTTRPTTTTTTAPQISALTGLPADEEIRARPVVAVKIDNADGKSTPQIGINEADVVYEIQVEGQVTRFLALYQSTDAAPIGPVRSARSSEIAILESLNNPLFTWHGANAILGSQVRNARIQPRSIDDISQLFFRERNRPSPYNSFVQGSAEIRATADEGSTGPATPRFEFAEPGEAPSAGAVPATTVNVNFTVPFGTGGGGAPVSYKWDGSLWRREQAGNLHVDAAGNQVAVENVIVQFVPAVDSGTVDKAGTRVPTADLVGEGEVWVFSQGTVTTGTWSKPDTTTPAAYRDQAGNPIKLTPGNTWISMPYSNAASSFE